MGRAVGDGIGDAVAVGAGVGALVAATGLLAIIAVGGAWSVARAQPLNPISSVMLTCHFFILN